MDFEIRRAGHVVLRVTDPFAEQAFFERVLGFQTTGQIGPSFFFLSANALSNHHMIALRAGKAGERLPEPERQIGMIAIVYEVVNPQALQHIAESIGEEGPAFGVTLLPTDHADRHIACRDGDGNRIEFVCTEAPAEGALRGPAAERAVRRTSHLRLRCRDLPRSSAFYQDALHLVPLAEATHERVVLAGNAARPPVLVLEQATETNVPLPTPKNMYGLEHFSMELGSFEQLRNAYHRLKERHVPLDHAVDHGVTNSVYLIDPDGNLMEVYHDVPRGEYRSPEDPFAVGGESLDERLEATTAG